MKRIRKWAIFPIALILILIASQLFSGNVKALTVPQSVDYPTDTHTAKGSDGYYSRNSSLTPTTVVDFASLGYDTSTIQSATLVSADGTVSATCDTTHCTFSSISGKIIAVDSDENHSGAVDSGTFDWWRNLSGGPHSYWWSFDLGGLNAGTYYAQPNPIGGNGCTVAPCPYPNGTYAFTGADAWKLNAANATYTDGSFSIGAAYVNLTSASINSSGRVVSHGNVNVDPSKMEVSFDAVVGRFDPGTGEDMIGSNPPGYQWSYEFKAKLTGTTYYYPSNWTLTIVPKGASPTPTPTITPTPTATPSPITGDFQITPSTINYRDSFKLHPLPFTIPASCTYTDHYYKIERGGSFVYTAKVYSQTVDTNYSYSTYPSIIAVGSHNVSLMIEASCGSSGFIATKTLTVNGPVVNSPPDFKIGWVKPTNNKVPLQTAVVGDRLDLIYIDDPSVPTPSDPDGDIIYWDDFNFNNSDAWTQTIPGNIDIGHYTDGYHNILMDTPGYHRVEASMHDQWGASTTRSTIIEVLPPNPIPVCTAPSELKENRTVAAGAINGTASYSPLGRTIDHSKDVWTNLKTSYVNGSSSDIIITVTLSSVTDSAGLTSLAGSDCHITLHPDLPPIGKLGVPAFSVRGTKTHIQNQSYSTDGDAIVSASYKYKYDTGNDGFANDSWQALSGNVSGADITPTKVGKYLFYVNSCEDYGRCGDNSTQTTSEITLDVVNKDGPVVSFDIAGENTLPTVVPKTLFSAQTVLSNWSLYQTNTNIAISKDVGWTSDMAGKLVAGLGRSLEIVQSFNFSYTQSGNNQVRQYIPTAQNFGLGPNGQSPYRSIDGTKPLIFQSQPLLIPGSTAGSWKPVEWGGETPPLIQSNSEHIFFSSGRPGNYYAEDYYSYPDSYAGFSFFAMNKNKIGRYSGSTTCGNPCYFPSYVHNYVDGSPYDYMLTPFSMWLPENGGRPAIKRANFYNYTDLNNLNYSKATNISMDSFRKVVVSDFKTSGRTLYVTLSWLFEGGYGLYDAYGDISRIDATLIEVRTFDLDTGKYLGSYQENRASSPSGIAGNYLNIVGDDLLTFGRGYITQLNRNAQIVKSTPFNPTLPGCSGYYTVGTFQGSDGGSYIENLNYCSPANKVSVVKINKDSTVAWTTVLRGAGYNPAGAFSWALGDQGDRGPLMIDNPVTHQMLFRSYNIISYGYDAFYELLDQTTGVSTPATGPATGWSYNNMPTVKLDGSYGSTQTTADGTAPANYAGGGILALNYYARTTNSLLGMQYVGDGMQMAIYSCTEGGYSCYTFVPYLAVGTPTTTPLPVNPIKLGQFVSNVTVGDDEMEMTFNMYKAKQTNSLAGLSFRMQDPTNRYAVETDGSVLYLSKYVNGARTVLSSANYPFLDNTDYTIKVTAVGSGISASLNGVPYLSATDSSWLTGTFGPFTDKTYTTFSNLSKKAVAAPATAWYAGFALWESGSATAVVKYDNISYTDSENDPASGTYQWFYKHTPKFLNNQGLSALDNQTFSGSQTNFEKVGVYDITLSAKDDPNPAFLYPSMLFDSYRKTSNTFHSSIVVHRRPVIPNFSSAIQGDGSVVFTDDAYDPDRYDPATSACSAPDVTGIDYCGNHGVVSRQYSFLDPNGNYTLGKPTHPSLVGSYTVYLQAVDEYGALSYPASTSFTTAIVVPATPPIATLTVPNGSFASPTMVGVKPDITWNQTDPDGYALINYQVQLFDSGGTLVVDSGIVAQNQMDGSQTWSVPVNLTLGAKYQVKVRVKDVYNWSAWSNINWMQINSAPVATMTVPNGTQASPTLFNTLRPTLQWSQTDIDPGTTFQYFQIQITNEANNTMILDSGQYYQGTTSTTGTWTVNADLPTGQKLRVRVRVFDGYTWSNYSAQTWLFINRAPTGNISYVTPIYQNDTPTFTVSVTDADGDPLLVKVASSFNGGAYTDIISWSNVASGSNRSFTYGPLNAGSYTLRLSLDDSRGGTYTQTYTFTVLPLSITGQVLHTPEWESYRQKWNVMFPSKLRAANVFWAGEELVLSAVVTNTGTSTTKPTSVSATLVQTGDEANLSSGDFVNYSGAMLNTNFVHSLSNGTYTMRFTVQWNNGLIQTNDVLFIIDSNIFAVLVNQLRN